MSERGYLGSYNEFKAEIGSIPRRLLKDNERPGRVVTRSDMLAIDADVVFSYDVETKKADIQFKAYFDNPGYERPPKQHRVVLHIVVKETDGLKRDISVPLQALMVGWGDVAEGSQGYCHSIAFLDEGRALEQWYYVGITTRNCSSAWRSTFRKCDQAATSDSMRLGVPTPVTLRSYYARSWSS